jgi:hypothetical protein
MKDRRCGEGVVIAVFIGLALWAVIIAAWAVLHG